MILKFLFNTGGRVSEIAGLRIKDLDSSEPKGRFDESYTKRRKARPFFLGPELYKDLNDFIDPQDKIENPDTVFRLSIRGV